MYKAIRMRMYLGMAVLQNKLFITGGCSHWNTEKSAWYHDMKSGEELHVEDMHEARYGHGLICVNDMVFAIGGEGPDMSSHDTVEVYDPKTNKWRTLEQKLDGRVYNTGAGLLMKYYLEQDLDLDLDQCDCACVGFCWCV